MGLNRRNFIKAVGATTVMPLTLTASGQTLKVNARRVEPTVDSQCAGRSLKDCKAVYRVDLGVECEVCGAKATAWQRDMVEVEQAVSNYREWIPGHIHAFCDKHSLKYCTVNRYPQASNDAQVIKIIIDDINRGGPIAQAIRSM